MAAMSAGFYLIMDQCAEVEVTLDARFQRQVRYNVKRSLTRG